MNDPADSPDAEHELPKAIKPRARHPSRFCEARDQINVFQIQTAEALDALKQLGVRVSWQSEPGIRTYEFDLSAFNGDLPGLAAAMYQLGKVQSRASELEPTLVAAIALRSRNIDRNRQKTSNAAAAKKAVRNELAQLLSESNTNERTDAALAKQIVPRLAGSVRREYSTVRKFLAELKMEIIELANEGDISRLDPESKVVAILERRRGEPGYTAETVRWTLAIKD